KTINEVEEKLPRLIESSDSNSKMIDSTQELANELSDRAIKGSKSIIQAIQSIQQISESRSKLEKFVTNIIEIADNTRLLSINASIEAANAGSRGSGFVVVANEIGKLASTTQIHANNATSLIEELKDKLELSINLSREGDNSLNYIFDGIDKTVDIINNFSKSISNETNNIQSVKNSINELIRITNDVKNMIDYQSEKISEYKDTLTKLEDLSSNIENILDEQTEQRNKLGEAMISLHRISNESKKNIKLLKTYLEKIELNVVDTNTVEKKNWLKSRKVGLILSGGGLGDAAFNDLGFAGFVKARMKRDFYFDYSDANNIDEIDSESKYLMEEKHCNYIIFMAGNVPGAADRVYKLSQKNTDKYFSLINGNIPIKGETNINTITYAQHESSYLGGVVSALCTKSGKIGFIGGVDLPMIVAFLVGYNQGIVDTNPDAKFEYTFIRTEGDMSGFNRAEEAYQIASDMYNRGIDVIFSPSGSSARGLIQCAKEMNKYVIGVDTNQDSLIPGNVLTSVLVRLDNTIYTLIDEYLDGNFKGGNILMGLKDEGVGITDFKYTRDIIGENNIKKIKTIEKEIIEEKIKVPDYLKGETGDLVINHKYDI
ncbi:MAG: BMP family ABC transporter substrate-binding protein, partial [Spirochaetota bacterium]